jgi:hypothetical protein
MRSTRYDLPASCGCGDCCPPFVNEFVVEMCCPPPGADTTEPWAGPPTRDWIPLAVFRYEESGTACSPNAVRTWVSPNIKPNPWDISSGAPSPSPSVYVFSDSMPKSSSGFPAPISTPILPVPTYPPGTCQSDQVHKIVNTAWDGAVWDAVKLSGFGTWVLQSVMVHPVTLDTLTSQSLHSTSDGVYSYAGREYPSDLSLSRRYDSSTGLGVSVDTPSGGQSQLGAPLWPGQFTRNRITYSMRPSYFPAGYGSYVDSAWPCPFDVCRDNRPSNRLWVFTTTAVYEHTILGIGVSSAWNQPVPTQSGLYPNPPDRLTVNGGRVDTVCHAPLSAAAKGQYFHPPPSGDTFYSPVWYRVRATDTGTSGRYGGYDRAKPTCSDFCRRLWWTDKLTAAYVPRGIPSETNEFPPYELAFHPEGDPDAAFNQSVVPAASSTDNRWSARTGRAFRYLLGMPPRSFIAARHPLPIEHFPGDNFARYDSLSRANGYTPWRLTMATGTSADTVTGPSVGPLFADCDPIDLRYLNSNPPENITRFRLSGGTPDHCLNLPIYDLARDRPYTDGLSPGGVFVTESGTSGAGVYNRLALCGLEINFVQAETWEGGMTFEQRRTAFTDDWYFFWNSTYASCPNPSQPGSFWLTEFFPLVADGATGYSGRSGLYWPNRYDGGPFSGRSRPSMSPYNPDLVWRPVGGLTVSNSNYTVEITLGFETSQVSVSDGCSRDNSGNAILFPLTRYTLASQIRVNGASWQPSNYAGRDVVVNGLPEGEYTVSYRPTDSSNVADTTTKTVRVLNNLANNVRFKLRRMVPVPTGVTSESSVP